MSAHPSAATGLWGILKVRLERRAEELAKRLVNHPRFTELIGRIEPDTAKAIREATDIISGYFDVGGRGPAWTVVNEVIDEFLGTAADEITRRATATAPDLATIDAALDTKLDRAVESVLDRMVWAENGQCWPTDCPHRSGPFNRKMIKPMKLSEALQINVRMYNCGCWQHLSIGPLTLAAASLPAPSAASAAGTKNYGRFLAEFCTADHAAGLAFTARTLGWFKDKPALEHALHQVFGPKGPGDMDDFRYIADPARSREEIEMLVKGYLSGMLMTTPGGAAAEASGPLGKLLDTLSKGPDAVVALVKSEADEFGKLFESIGRSAQNAAIRRQFKNAALDEKYKEIQRDNAEFDTRRAAQARRSGWILWIVMVLAVLAALWHRKVLPVTAIKKFANAHDVLVLLLAIAVVVLIAIIWLVRKYGPAIYEWTHPPQNTNATTPTPPSYHGGPTTGGP